MNFFKEAKLAQYRVRQWLKSIFFYPKHALSLAALDYDNYWNQKRPQNQKVILAPAEAERARIIAALIPPGDIRIGDIGSGPGVVLKAILETKPYASGIAFDSSPRALEDVRSLGIEGILLDITAPGALDSVEVCDYYLVLEVLEHVANSEEVLATLFKKAKHGVFFSVPNTGFLTHRFRLLFGKAPAQWIHMPNEHLRFWTIIDMHWWLRALHYQSFQVIPYRGIPVLNTLWPNLFAEGMVVFIKKHA